MGFGALVFAGFAGAISGSLAWWAYSTRASVAYQGTSINSSEQLQIGLKTTIDMSHYEMTTDEDNYPGYYFCDPGAGLPADAIAHYLSTQGTYATNELQPITAGSFPKEGAVDPLALDLRNPLVSGNPEHGRTADEDKYVRIPLAFRVLRYNNSSTPTFTNGENIWLSDAVVEASVQEENSEVHKAIRMYTSGSVVTDVDRTDPENPVFTYEAAKRLINPSDDSEDQGQTAVAGILDISGSGYYDSYDKGGKSYCVVYGETNKTPQELEELQNHDDEDHHQSPSAHSGLIDFNQVFSPNQVLNDEQHKSTFVSKYYKGTYHPKHLAEISPKYQTFDTLGTVKPDDNDDDGRLVGDKPLCATKGQYAIADLDLTIWLEGWDHHVIDKENQHHFNLGLQFQISRL